MTTALEGVRDQRHAPAALYPRERPGTHSTGGRVGPRDGYGKSRPPPGFDPRTFDPVANRYTDYATRPTTQYNAQYLFYGKYNDPINVTSST